MHLRAMLFTYLFGAACFVQNTAAQPAPTFSDLPQQAEVRLAITRLTDQGIMTPRSPATFAPAEVSSLGEYLVSVQHMFDLPPPAHPAMFTDVPPTSPYYAAVQATAPYLGRQVLCFTCALSTNLYLDQPISRAQTTVTLVNILVARGSLRLVDEPHAAQILANVSDAAELSPPARLYLATAISANLLPRTPALTLQIAQPQTRADLAVTLDRVQTEFRVPQVRQSQTPIH
jgi:hypothetical protein